MHVVNCFLLSKCLCASEKYALRSTNSDVFINLDVFVAIVFCRHVLQNVHFFAVISCISSSYCVIVLVRIAPKRTV